MFKYLFSPDENENENDNQQDDSDDLFEDIPEPQHRDDNTGKDAGSDDD